mgnify:CR=1 FL=1
MQVLQALQALAPLDALLPSIIARTREPPRPRLAALLVRARPARVCCLMMRHELV